MFFSVQLVASSIVMGRVVVVWEFFKGKKSTFRSQLVCEPSSIFMYHRVRSKTALASGINLLLSTAFIRRSDISNFPSVQFCHFVSILFLGCGFFNSNWEGSIFHILVQILSNPQFYWHT